MDAMRGDDLFTAQFNRFTAEPIDIDADDEAAAA
jgi:hypothetical protein